MKNTSQIPNLPPNCPQWIWGIDQVFEVLEYTEDFLCARVNTESGEAIAAKLEECISLYASSANVLAACRWYMDAAFRQEVHLYADELKSRAGDTFKPLVAPSILNAYLKSRCAEWSALYTRAERQNAGLTHSMEGLRSLLSKLKEDKRIQNFAGQMK